MSMIRKQASLLFACVYLLLPLAIHAQSEVSGLTVTPRTGPSVKLELAQLKSLPAASVQVKDDSGSMSEYTGVSVSALLAASGVELGKAIRGDRLAEYVMVAAADGYRVLFALAEVDSAFRSGPILLCYAKNGLPIPDKEGPLRLVVADEDRHARWVRQVTTISVGHVP